MLPNVIGALQKLTRVGTGELLELLSLGHWRASYLDGALSGHRGHLGGSHAEGGGHCDGFGVSETKSMVC